MTGNRLPQIPRASISEKTEEALRLAAFKLRIREPELARDALKYHPAIIAAAEELGIDLAEEIDAIGQGGYRERLEK